MSIVLIAKRKKLLKCKTTTIVTTSKYGRYMITQDQDYLSEEGSRVHSSNYTVLTIRVDRYGHLLFNLLRGLPNI